MDRLIVDASVAIAWVHPGQATPETDALLVLERRGKLTAEERTTGLGALVALNCEIDHEMAPLALTRLSQLAEEMKLSAYDAAYRELALRRGLVAKRCI